MEIELRKLGNLGQEFKPDYKSHSIDVDIIDANEALNLYFDLAGFRVDSLKISIIDENVLKVEASRQLELMPLESALLQERLQGSFLKEIVLPAMLNLEKILMKIF